MPLLRSSPKADRRPSKAPRSLQNAVICSHVLGALLGLAGPVAAQQGDGLRLRMQPGLLDAMSVDPDGKDKTPLFIDADRMEGNPDAAMDAEGNVRMRKRGQVMYSDWARYTKGDDELYAVGNVRLEQRGDVMEGPRARINMDTRQGFMETPRFWLNAQGGRGNAEQMNLEGPDLYRMTKVNYTTCGPEQEDWWIRASDLRIDKARDVGQARNAVVDFMGVPILYSPYLDFSLNNQRKSGFLTPTFATTGKSGGELSIPYYWNIAPNRDATFTPHFMQKRGVLLHNEFRYLDRLYRGEARFEILPGDKSRGGEARSALSVQHTQSIASGVARGWGVGINIQRVSDDDYFRELSNQVAVTSQVILPRDVVVSRGGTWWNGGIWAVAGQVQRWQTLQERLAPITAPYNRQPSLIFNALKQDVAGFDFNLHTSYVDFNHPTLANGRRVLAYPHLSLPLQTSYAYVTPKIGLHSTHYILDSTTTTLPDSSRHVPIGSVEGGLIFERETAIGGRGFVQTLEPKAYYVRIPTRNQNLIPNFESGLQDINFATIFSENQFSGQDRINDADQITVGVTSRLLARDTGAELIRAGIAQRYYFKSQEVTLPGTPPRDSLSSDLLATLSGNIARGWIAEAGWQFNTDRSETQKLSAGMRYQPAPGKVVNAGYRFTRNVLEQVEVSTQWPIAPQWTVLGRLNQSIRERRMLDSLLGFEYNASCWSLRVVASRVATTVTSASTAVFVQLELNGVSKVGSNPLSTLIQNISGYTPTGQSSPGQSTVNRSDVHYAR